MVVQFDDTAHELGGRHVSGEHEDTKRAVVGWLPRFRLTGSAVEDRRLAQPALAGGDAFELDVVAHVDFRVVLGFGSHRRVAGEVRFADEHRDFGGVFGQEHGFLCRGETAADDQHLPAGEEFAVACGAVGHAAASVLGLAGETKLAWAGSGGNQDAERFQVTARRVHGLDVTVHVKAGSLG